MTPNLTPDQINQLRSLGIFSDPVIRPISKLELNLPPLSKGGSRRDLKFNSFLPLISIAGITLVSFSGIILLKNQTSDPAPVASTSPKSSSPVQQQALSPTSTPAPVAIQSYLLSSQQLFTQALQLQKTPNNSNEQVVNLLNQSILAASDAIKYYPGDYRGS